MNVLLWADFVNKKILDSTTISAGTGGVIEDSQESGAKRRRLASSAVADVFAVTMDFDWLEKDSQGFSEYDRFMRWYKYSHKRGTVPFSFPSITKFNTQGSLVDSLYLIISEPQAQKSGFSMRVTMTWREYFTGVVEVSLSDREITNISGTSKYLRVYYNQDITSDTIFSRNFQMAVIDSGTAGTPTNLSENYFKGYLTEDNHTDFYFTTELTEGAYRFYVDGKYGDFEV